MVAEWLRLIGGMLEISIRGAEQERFLNLCTREHIELRRPRRMDIDEMRAEISLRDFCRLARTRGHTRCRVHILRRKGLPFVWKRLRRRYALWLGMLFICFVCYELCSRIWVIQTEFYPGVDEYAVLQELEQIGIGIGAKSADIDAKEVQLHMMTELDDLKYFSVSLDGNTMLLQAAAVTDPPEKETADGQHNVIAAKDGIIEKMVIHRGTEQCSIGDAVLQGQTLVDALVEKQSELDETQFVDANAEIWASTRYHITSRMPLEAYKMQRTGEIKRKYAVCFGKTRINLYFSSSLTEGNCDRIITTEEIRLNEYLMLPVFLSCETILPYTTKEVVRDAEALQDELEYGARRTVERQLQEGCLTSMQADLRTDHDAAELHAVVWCYEQIAARAEDDRTQADLPPEIEENEE